MLAIFPAELRCTHLRTPVRRADAAGRAEVAVCRLADLVEGDAAYDGPAVLLTPVDPEAAPVVVEVQQDDLWWVSVADGPGSELHADMETDRFALLGSMVRSVLQGLQPRSMHARSEATIPPSATVERLVRGIRDGR